MGAGGRRTCLRAWPTSSDLRRGPLLLCQRPVDYLVNECALDAMRHPETAWNSPSRRKEEGATDQSRELWPAEEITREIDTPAVNTPDKQNSLIRWTEGCEATCYGVNPPLRAEVKMPNWRQDNAHAKLFKSDECWARIPNPNGQTNRAKLDPDETRSDPERGVKRHEDMQEMGKKTPSKMACDLEDQLLAELEALCRDNEPEAHDSSTTDTTTRHCCWLMLRQARHRLLHHNTFPQN